MTPFERAVRIASTEARDPVAYIQSEIEGAIIEVMARVGTVGVCEHCGTGVWWIRHNNNRTVPFSSRGVMHALECPARKDKPKPHRKASKLG